MPTAGPSTCCALAWTALLPDGHTARPHSLAASPKTAALVLCFPTILPNFMLQTLFTLFIVCLTHWKGSSVRAVLLTCSVLCYISSPLNSAWCVVSVQAMLVSSNENTGLGYNRRGFDCSLLHWAPLWTQVHCLPSALCLSVCICKIGSEQPLPVL